MANRVIHLFNGFLNPHGGSELEALSLADQLRAHGDVKLWATSSRSPAALRERHGIERIGFGHAWRGGYANSIRHGENGFLFNTTEEARDIMRVLLDQPGLRATIARNARRTVEALYSRNALARRVQFHLGHAMSPKTA